MLSSLTRLFSAALENAASAGVPSSTVTVELATGSDVGAVLGTRWRLAEAVSVDSLFGAEDLDALATGPEAVFSSAGTAGAASAVLVVFFFVALLDCMGLF